jgi:hypothetical protein
MAFSFVRPHTSAVALKFAQTAGYEGVSWTRQMFPSVRLTQRTPAFFPAGMPGRDELIEMAMQQAAQPIRHITVSVTHCLPVRAASGNYFSFGSLYQIRLFNIIMAK